MNKYSKDKKDVPSVYNFYSYITKKFNDEAIEDIVDLELQKEASPLVRVVPGNETPIIRFHQVRLKDPELLKLTHHVQITYYLYIAKNQNE